MASPTRNAVSPLHLAEAFYAKGKSNNPEDRVAVKIFRVATTALALLSGFFLFKSAPILFSSTVGAAAVLSIVFVVTILTIDFGTRLFNHELGERYAVNKLRPILPDLSRL